MEGIFHLLEAECSTIRNFVLLVGLLYLLKITLSLICSLWSGTKAFILSGLFRVKITSSYGWAVVTGASAGIGREYAIQLAKCGVNVVLMSNVMDELKSVEKEILDQYNVKVKIIMVDFNDGAKIYDKIRMELSGLEIGILINNVGVGFKNPPLNAPEYFLNILDDQLWKLINVNMATVIMMTKMILPDMLDKKRGIIVNMSSTIALNPTPLMSVYGATKAFIDYFTSALQYEYSGQGVIIQVVQPGVVATELSRNLKDSFTALPPHKYVKDAMATIGVQGRTFGTISHALQGWILQNLLPSWLLMRISYQSLNNAREATIRNKQKKQ